MRAFTVGKNDAEQRLDRFLAKAVPRLPASLAQKYIRIKRVKVNGARAAREQRLHQGDTVQCYINDEFFGAPDSGQAWRAIAEPELRIAYEDGNLLLLDKPAGQLCHADASGSGGTLVDHLLAYLARQGAWESESENAFTPALCNRIDRNTSGLVIAAKNAETLRVLNDKIKGREIAKYYLCACFGVPRPAEGAIACFLRKEEANNLVRVYRHPIPGGRTAETRYRTLMTRGELSLVEAELLTGRTHQIRASFAARGFPLLGDGKYGSGAANRRYGESSQLLCACRLRFDFPTDAGALNYLRGKTVYAQPPAFQKRYFS